MPPLTRWQELFDAIIGAEVTPSDFRVFVTLLKTADYGPADIPLRFQPRSVVKLAGRCHISVAGVKRSLDHLERHGWIKRRRHFAERGIGGRGHPTTYELLRGQDCDCKKQAQREPVKRSKQAQPEPINRLTASGIAAGQDRRGDERAVTGGKGGADSEWGCWPDDTIGACVNSE